MRNERKQFKGVMAWPSVESRVSEMPSEENLRNVSLEVKGVFQG